MKRNLQNTTTYLQTATFTSTTYPLPPSTYTTVTCLLAVTRSVIKFSACADEMGNSCARCLLKVLDNLFTGATVNTECPRTFITLCGTCSHQSAILWSLPKALTLTITRSPTSRRLNLVFLSWFIFDLFAAAPEQSLAMAKALDKCSWSLRTYVVVVTLSVTSGMPNWTSRGNLGILPCIR